MDPLGWLLLCSIFFFKLLSEIKKKGGEVLPFFFFFKFGFFFFFLPLLLRKRKKKRGKRKKEKNGEKTRELSVGEREENLQGKKVSVCTQEFGLPVPQECLATNFQQHYVQSIIKWWEGARSSQGGGAQSCGSETRLSSPDE